MIIEKEDVFEIDRELVVATCRSDSWSLQLELESPNAKWTLSIGGVVSVRRRDEETISATPSIPGLVGESVVLLQARKTDGELVIRFTHDWVLTVKSDPHYEAWEMYSSRGERLIAVPGDGIAKWGAVDASTGGTQ